MKLTAEEKRWLELAPPGYIREILVCPDAFKKKRREFAKK